MRTLLVSVITCASCCVLVAKASDESLQKKGTATKLSPHVMELKARDLVARIVDNVAVEEHKAHYNGIMSLIRPGDGKNIFNPTFSGINYEHNWVHSDNPAIKAPEFKDKHEEWIYNTEPRMTEPTMTIPGPGHVRLHWAPTEAKGMEAEVTFTAAEPYYVDFEIWFVLHKKEWIPVREMGSLWACYMNQPKEIELYFVGHTQSNSTPRWVKMGRRKGDDKEPHGYWFESDEGVLEEGLDYFDWNWDEPFFYGLMNDNVFILMLDRTESVQPKLNPRGGGPTSPAWDFQFMIKKPEIGKKYLYWGRVAYKNFLGRDDVRQEYETWRMKRTKSR